MAQFQPLEFNYQLDPSLVQPPASTFSLGSPMFGSPGLGGGGASLQALGNVGTSGQTPGTLFSSLFGGDGIFSAKSMFGGTDGATGQSFGGWAPSAIGIGQAILGGIQGNRAMKLAQDQFSESKRQFDLNFGAQRRTINTNLEDRQRARVASNPGAYEAVDTYLKKNSV